MKTMNRREAILFTGFISFLVFLAIVSWTYPFQAALFPRMLIAAGFLIAGTELIRKVWGKEGSGKHLSPRHEELPDEDTREDGLRIAIYAACGFSYIILLPTLGYMLAQFLILGTLLKLYGIGWKTALALAVGTALASYLVFAVALELPLPKGVAEGLLF